MQFATLPAVPNRMVQGHRYSPYVVRLGNPGKHLYPAPLTHISSAEFRDLLSVNSRTAMHGLLYVHLPFCETLCTFCPIQKSKLTPHSPVDDYMTALLTELRALAELPLVRALRFDTVYFGGGTPSVTPDRWLAELMQLIQNRFKLANPQITFEGHVRSLTPEKIRFVRSLGCSRLSVGIQTFDRELRRKLNLTPTEDEIRRCVSVAREEGFDDFNIDLMYNLPGQTAKIWARDLQEAVALQPSGLDVYETVIDRGTPLHRQIENGDLSVEWDPARLAWSYRFAEDFLAAHGYLQRNLFVWDRPGFRNSLVGRQAELRDEALSIVGAGQSAYSFINGLAFLNETKQRLYIERTRVTGHGIKTFHRCSPREEMERFMVMSLEELYFDRARFAAAFACDLEDVFRPQLRRLGRRRLIEPIVGGYRLTPLGRAWATTMTLEFFSSPALEEILKARIDGTFMGGMTYEDELALPAFALFHPRAVFTRRPKLSLIVSYVRFLRRINPRWVRDFTRLCTIAAYWYVLLRVMSAIAAPRFLLRRAFGQRASRMNRPLAYPEECPPPSR